MKDLLFILVLAWILPAVEAHSTPQESVSHHTDSFETPRISRDAEFRSKLIEKQKEVRTAYHEYEKSPRVDELQMLQRLVTEFDDLKIQRQQVTDEDVQAKRRDMTAEVRTAYASDVATNSDADKRKVRNQQGTHDETKVHTHQVPTPEQTTSSDSPEQNEDTTPPENDIVHSIAMALWIFFLIIIAVMNIHGFGWFEYLPKPKRKSQKVYAMSYSSHTSSCTELEQVRSDEISNVPLTPSAGHGGWLAERRKRKNDFATIDSVERKVAIAQTVNKLGDEKLKAVTTQYQINNTIRAEEEAQKGHKIKMRQLESEDQAITDAERQTKLAKEAAAKRLEELAVLDKELDLEQKRINIENIKKTTPTPVPTPQHQFQGFFNHVTKLEDLEATREILIQRYPKQKADIKAMYEHEREKILRGQSI